MFRLLLIALSQPSKVLNIREFSEKLYGNAPNFLAVAMTLLDNEVTFSTCGDEALATEIVSLTLAKRAEIRDADFIFVTEEARLRDAVENAKCGTLRDPHKSATIVVRAGDTKTVRLRLSGPGIRDVAELDVPAAVDEALRLRDARDDEYPQGIDFIFVSDNGELMALPRLTRREV
jgi:alpha-D-ribose 1-methylphosphonate 5-triphosphate synthase subunit PhnH